MHARPLLTFKPIAGALALALGVFGTTAHAVSSPILSVADVLTDSLNVGGAAQITFGPNIFTNSGSHHLNYTSSTDTDFSTEVVTEPTTTTAGLALNYQTDTTTNEWDLRTWNSDSLFIGLASNGTNQSGGKWISLTGSVQSSIDTTLSFDLYASGSFTAMETPLGSTAPLLASFYFGEAQPSSLSAITSANMESLSYYSYSASYSTAAFNLLAGMSQNFVAYVYAPDAVSVDDFQLHAYTSDYNVVVIPQTQVSVGPKTLIGASILAPIPEPETYAMMLAGLGLVGAVVRRNKVKTEV